MTHRGEPEVLTMKEMTIKSSFKDSVAYFETLLLVIGSWIGPQEPYQELQLREVCVTAMERLH